jgi:ABC-type transport system substrate-binding protein
VLRALIGKRPTRRPPKGAKATSRLGWLVNERLISPACVLALGVTVVLAVAACGPSVVEPTPGAQQPQRGGRLYVLSNSQSVDIDPACVYSPEVAFLGATLMRSLVTYTLSPDPEMANAIQPDLANDTGTPNADATKWTFTLRDGPRWQDGTPVTCDDLKYGISRLFATDVFIGGPPYAIQYLDIPTDTDGSSAYKGPYDGTGQELYDQAVECGANAITFHLKRAVPDFAYATLNREANAASLRRPDLVQSDPTARRHPGRSALLMVGLVAIRGDGRPPLGHPRGGDGPFASRQVPAASLW